ncbi:MAG: type pilus assembly protein PilA [Solirubrobacteraceae bacterium]|nr:prepilin-type N-terminal cleavage/methylation protein [Solirubrobacterales bacterium]MEA2214527.1 type pilus assembly protein PilA [Solirubrobacteraceae bacterium]
MTARLHDAGVEDEQGAGSTPGLPPRERAQDGYSLIELLVVCLMIGALCAIAIPQFLSQSAKAKDVSAKELLHGAQVTAEAIGAENDGSYESVTTTELNRIEPAIAIEKSESHAYVTTTTHSPREYSVTAKATDGTELTLSRNTAGEVGRSCRSPKNVKSCSQGETGSW